MGSPPPQPHPASASAGDTILIASRKLCHAQLLSAYDQVYGSWDIQLSRHVLSRRRWYLPTRDDSVHNNGVQKKIRKRIGTIETEKEDGDLQLLFPEVPSRHNNAMIHHTTTKSVRSVSCVLNIEKNGKFSLTHVEDGRCSDGMKPSSANNFDHDDPIDDSTSISNQQQQHQPLRGEWYLTPNPYCVTDRHYDTLLLISEPRMRHCRRSNIIEKATVELRCKVWGRYGGGAVRRAIGMKHGRIRGRMTHGTILIVKEEAVVDGNKRKKRTLVTREIVGAFGGRALVESEALNKTNDDLDFEEEANDDDDGDDDFDGI
ncbi:hypothetical protein ACHAWU_008749 [Discostella pseudostelligera]|uniref:Uncharacterized protein n=1 Tax=Discostella pseudostelligera TaxID=259834 RepID=A0ABD3N3C7_9STRA